jgi:hypothetical protein
VRVSDKQVYVSYAPPRDVVTLFRAVLCTVRRAIERQTGTMPTEGEAFDAMGPRRWGRSCDLRFLHNPGMNAPLGERPSASGASKN